MSKVSFDNVRDCPICDCHLPVCQYAHHMKQTHSTTDALTDTEIKAIRTNVQRDDYYSWADFQWEQHGDL